MTNKEFFIKRIEEEEPVFIKIINAVPKERASYKPHDKARAVDHLVIQLAVQPAMISNIVTAGILDFTKPYANSKQNLDGIAEVAKKNFAALKENLAKASDKDWEDGIASMIYPGGKWETKKYDMAWGMLFDAIHHRGQLSTYIRVMGGKVPSIYGGSADERPPT